MTRGSDRIVELMSRRARAILPQLAVSGRFGDRVGGPDGGAERDALHVLPLHLASDASDHQHAALKVELLERLRTTRSPRGKAGSSLVFSRFGRAVSVDRAGGRFFARLLWHALHRGVFAQKQSPLAGWRAFVIDAQAIGAPEEWVGAGIGNHFNTLTDGHVAVLHRLLPWAPDVDRCCTKAGFTFSPSREFPRLVFHVPRRSDGTGRFLEQKMWAPALACLVHEMTEHLFASALDSLLKDHPGEGEAALKKAGAPLDERKEFYLSKTFQHCY